MEKGCEIKLAIVTAIITLMGIIAGVYLTNSLTNEAWDNQYNIEQNNFVIKQRLELIQETSLVMGKAPGYDEIFQFHIINGQVILDEKNSSYFVNDPDISIQLAEYKGQYESVLILDTIYFGPNTSSAIQELSKEKGPWWAKSRNKTDAVIIAMREELYYGIKNPS